MHEKAQKRKIALAFLFMIIQVIRYQQTVTHITSVYSVASTSIISHITRELF